MKCGVKESIWRLCKIHKHRPRPNTITFIKVIAVTISKHSEHDTELTCFVICTALEPLRHRKLHWTACSVWARSTDGMCVRFYLWVLCMGFPVSVVTTPLVSLGRIFATWTYRKSTLFDRTGCTEQLLCSNSCVTICAAIAVRRTDSIALSVTTVSSILSQTKSVELPLPKYLR